MVVRRRGRRVRWPFVWQVLKDIMSIFTSVNLVKILLFLLKKGFWLVVIFFLGKYLLENYNLGELIRNPKLLLTPTLYYWSLGGLGFLAALIGGLLLSLKWPESLINFNLVTRFFWLLIETLQNVADYLIRGHAVVGTPVSTPKYKIEVLEISFRLGFIEYYFWKLLSWIGALRSPVTNWLNDNWWMALTLIIIGVVAGFKGRALMGKGGFYWRVFMIMTMLTLMISFKGPQMMKVDGNKHLNPPSNYLEYYDRAMGYSK